MAASWKCRTRWRESKTASTEPGAGAAGEAEASGRARSDAMASAACSTVPSWRIGNGRTRSAKLGQIDPDALDLGVLGQRVVPALAAEAGLLVAAERQAR